MKGLGEKSRDARELLIGMKRPGVIGTEPESKTVESDGLAHLILSTRYKSSTSQTEKLEDNVVLCYTSLV